MSEPIIVRRDHEYALTDIAEVSNTAPHLMHLLDPEYWGALETNPAEVPRLVVLPTAPAEQRAVTRYVAAQLFTAWPDISLQRALGPSDHTHVLEAGDHILPNGLTYYQTETLLVNNTPALWSAALMPRGDSEPRPPEDPMAYPADFTCYPFVHANSAEGSGQLYAHYNRTWQAILPLPGGERAASVSSVDVTHAIIGKPNFLSEPFGMAIEHIPSAGFLATALLGLPFEGSPTVAVIAYDSTHSPILPPGLTVSLPVSNPDHTQYMRVTDATHFDL